MSNNSPNNSPNNSSNNSSNNLPIKSLKVIYHGKKNGKNTYVYSNGKIVTKKEYNNYVKKLQEIQDQCKHVFEYIRGTNAAGIHGIEKYECKKCGFKMSDTNYNNKYVKSKQAECEHVIEVVHGKTFQHQNTSYVCKECGKTNLTKKEYNNFITMTQENKKNKCEHKQVRRRIINDMTLNNGLIHKFEYYCLNCPKIDFTKEQYEDAKKNNQCKHVINYTKTNTINSGKNQGTYYICEKCEDYVEKDEYNRYNENLMKKRFKGVDMSKVHMNND